MAARSIQAPEIPRRQVSGLFFTFEGIDGCGKSTQVKLLADALTAAGVNPIYTREPGGTRVGERVRPLLLSDSSADVFPLTEVLLLAAARAQHVLEVIKPGVAGGRVVLCDRYTDSTVAFQGHGRGVNLEIIDDVNRIATGGLMPDLTILYDVDLHVARARLDARPPRPGAEPARDRFDVEDLQFHNRVRTGYLELAAAAPGRIRVIDSSRPIEAVHAETKRLVLELVGSAGGS